MKSLVALCGLVAHPSYYHYAVSFPGVTRLQEANSWVFERLALGYRSTFFLLYSPYTRNETRYFTAIAPCDLPGHFEHLLEPYEIEALATAYRVLRHARALGADIPSISVDKDQFVIELANGMEDFQFMQRSEVWSRPGPYLDDGQWVRLVLGA